jgi:hypothetical protein
MIEILVSLFLWTGIDPNYGAELKVDCENITIEYGGRPTSGKIVVKFAMQGVRQDRLWFYEIPMSVAYDGRIVLTPYDFWLEELRIRESVTFEIQGKEYFFELKETSKLKC